MNRRGNSSERRYGVIMMLAGLAILIGACWLIYLSVEKSSGIVGPFITGLFAVVAVVAGHAYSTRTAALKARRDRMSPNYERLVEMIYAIAKGETADDQVAEQFEELSRLLLLWGSPEMLQAFIAWRKETQQNQHAPREVMLALERLLVSIRREMGSSATGIGEGDLLRVIISDYDTSEFSAGRVTA